MNKTIETIIVGSSLTSASDGLVADALALARPLGARVRLVHAYSPPFDVIGGPLPSVWLGAVPFESRTREARIALEAQMARAGVRREESAGCVVGPPPAHRLLVDEAKGSSGALIAVGAGEAGRRLPRLLGSTADRLLRTATCPVLVHRGRLRVPPRRVLVPVDLSELSASACGYAQSLLRQMGSAPAPELAVVLVMLPGQQSEQFTVEQLRKLAEQELQHLVTAAGEAGAKVRTVLLTGDPTDEILAEIAVGDADLVVMGSHGRSGFERHVLGSVAAEVARSSACSVLVVPPDPAA